MPNLIIIPGSLALVRELAPADSAARTLRHACASIAPADAEPIDVVCSLDSRWHTGHTGSFRAWGAPSVTVGAGNHAGELVARYVLADSSVDHLRNVRQVRGSLGSIVRTTVVVIDGSAGLTQRAPLALREHGQWAHNWCQDLLSQGPAAVAACDPARLHAAGVEEPHLWEDLARLHPVSTQLLAADSSLGVGRYVASWQLPALKEGADVCN
ncbi:hypothetical protein G7Y31_07160 [Corynebacterium lizhenjunii]|uniref:Uncharacterized protein n=1 Tax=Corynebacterium lizhenjunii TaxID=2709394 RepID=A0A7T0PB45_9CORY|nr:hypothetical protein [Corynebacterium lizhenjunii]QPK78357.1 hypothetical protein G7Y31_07160 [Corynebacterium lizhenjunii]